MHQTTRFGETSSTFYESNPSIFPFVPIESP